MAGTPALARPDEHLHAAWLEAYREWGPGLHEDGFGLRAGDEVGPAEGFAAWVGRLIADPSCTYRWIVQEGRVLGGIALRHPGHEAVPRAGHIGYGIRPSARGRGLAGWALGEMKLLAAAAGMAALQVHCERDNHASRRTIEAQGGVPAEPAGDAAVIRYRIPLTGAAPRAPHP